MTTQAVHSGDIEGQIADARTRCEKSASIIRSWERGDRDHLSHIDYQMAKAQLRTWSQILDVRMEIRDRVKVR